MLEFEGRQIPNDLREIIDPKRSVLLVWDMQNDQAGGSFNKEALIRNAPPLIDAAAKAKVKTVYTRQTPFLWKDEAAVWIRRGMKDQKVDHPSKLKPRRLHGSVGWNIMEPFKPRPEDTVIDKRRPTMFIGNEFETIVSNLANGYSPVGASGFERATYLDWTSKTGNASIYTTADDLLRFHRALQSGSLLKPETLKQSYGFERKDRTVGMFWFHRQRFGHRSVYVNGSSPGFKAHFERFIDDAATVVVLSNLYIAAPSTIAEDLGAMLFDQPVNRDVPRPMHVNATDLKRFAGTFRFGDDYFVKNAVVRVEPQIDHLDLAT